MWTRGIRNSLAFYVHLAKPIDLAEMRITLRKQHTCSKEAHSAQRCVTAFLTSGPFVVGISVHPGMSGLPVKGRYQ